MRKTRSGGLERIGSTHDCAKKLKVLGFFEKTGVWVFNGGKVCSTWNGQRQERRKKAGGWGLREGGGFITGEIIARDSRSQF